MPDTPPGFVKPRARAVISYEFPLNERIRTLLRLEDLYDKIEHVRAASKIIEQLYKAFVDNCASLAEINPLVVTPKGDIVALDATAQRSTVDRNSGVTMLWAGFAASSRAEPHDETTATSATNEFSHRLLPTATISGFASPLARRPADHRS